MLRVCPSEDDDDSSDESTSHDDGEEPPKPKLTKILKVDSGGQGDDSAKSSGDDDELSNGSRGSEEESTRARQAVMLSLPQRRPRSRMVAIISDMDDFLFMMNGAWFLNRTMIRRYSMNSIQDEQYPWPPLYYARCSKTSCTVPMGQVTLHADPNLKPLETGILHEQVAAIPY